MDVTARADILRRFDQMPDPRGPNAIHDLADMVVMAILAVICGADGWVQVEMFAKAKRKWLATFLDLSEGIPSHDTFGRVFSLLDPDAFERCFGAWTAELVNSCRGKLVAIDGKAIRRSFTRSWDKSGMVHLVSADLEALGQAGHDWPGLAAIVRVESIRDVDGVISTEQRLYLTSLKGTDAARAGDLVRGHWSVENQLHWQLDVSFNEDQRRIRTGHGAENYSRLNRMALNLLKRDKKHKVGIQTKRLNAGWDHNYMLGLISG